MDGLFDALTFLGYRNVKSIKCSKTTIDKWSDESAREVRKMPVECMHA